MPNIKPKKKKKITLQIEKVIMSHLFIMHLLVCLIRLIFFNFV